MFKRSELRHACYRAKNNAVSDKNQPMLDVIKPLLQQWQTWDNFSKEWDILLDREGKIYIVKPEIDYDFIHSTLLEASLYSKNNISFDKFDARKKNIIEQAELLMLDNIMTWENYSTVWGVFVDPQINAFRTRLYNLKLSQKSVTDEMISASTGNADGAAFSEPLLIPSIDLKPIPKESVPDIEAAIKEATQRTSKK